MSPMLMVSALVLAVGLAWVLVAHRWKRGMDVSSAPRYVAHLATLSEASVRRNFDPYTDIDWDSTEFDITENDPRWVLSETDALGRQPWYQKQPQDKQIAIAMWRHANMAKVAIHFEDILVRGLMHYAFWVPNGSPEFRYCVHEAIEEGNHTLMFQELVNRIGADVPGMAWWLRWLSPGVTLAAHPLPSSFFFTVLAGEVPFDYLQSEVLRDNESVHPLLTKVIGIHVTEEARHIAFGHQYLRRHVPQLWPISRFFLSMYVPVAMRVLGQAMVVPPRSFFRKFGIPRSVRRDLLFGSADDRQKLRDMFADIRMLCHDVGLMNPFGRLMWRICRIHGRPSRYRNEPQRAHLSEGRHHTGAMPRHEHSAAPTEKQDAGTPV